MSKTPEKKIDNISKLAHDLKSPLHVLKSYFANVPAPEDEDFEKFHEAAQNSLESMMMLVSSMNNKQPEALFTPKHADIVEVIHSVIKKLYSLAHDKGIRLRYIGPLNLISKFDIKLLDRLITNLITNAIEATTHQQSSILICVRYDHNNIWVEVRDNMGGISKTIIDKIFDDNFTHGKENGNGIGLSICKDIMELHKGTIDVHSIDGQGTVFTLAFPGTMFLANETPQFQREHSIH